MGVDMQLDGVKVLVLEDSYLIAELIEDMLLQAGAIVVGTTKTVALALHVLATQAVDLACLDINLEDENSFPVADELASRGIPFVFVTASTAEILPQRHSNRTFVPKMQMTDELVAACWTTLHVGPPALIEAASILPRLAKL
jgi:chemotaxis family two-component system sensor kinase Cph1